MARQDYTRTRIFSQGIFVRVFRSGQDVVDELAFACLLIIENIRTIRKSHALMLRF